MMKLSILTVSIEWRMVVFVLILNFIVLESYSIIAISNFPSGVVSPILSSSSSSLFSSQKQQQKQRNSFLFTKIYNNKNDPKSSSLLPLSMATTKEDSGIASASSSSSTTGTTSDIPSPCTTKNNDYENDELKELQRIRKNTAYIESLINNLETILDQYILSKNIIPDSSTHTSITDPNRYLQQALNIYELIQRHTTTIESSIVSSNDIQKELFRKAQKMLYQAGITFDNTVTTNNQKNDNDPITSNSTTSSTNVVLGTTNEGQRKQEAFERQQWEALRSQEESNLALGGRSALSRRQINSKDNVEEDSDDNNNPNNMFLNGVLNIQQAKQLLQQPDDTPTPSTSTIPTQSDESDRMGNIDTNDDNDETTGLTIVSEYIAQAGIGIGNNFDGTLLGIGGLDNVLQQIKRRVWIPLAAPPLLLQQLGIQPVRGVLLYGQSGNGKTLLAQTIGRILSPLRPITIVSGPEIMDKFVGSSEQKLRTIFDTPPEIYDQYKNSKYGPLLSKSALHVIIMDEFDAIARARGGRGGSGDQGDAGVARDSVVNQLLAKMDGVAPLVVPTLVIGLTNRRSLIDKALLRPGRFEVHIEVPPPRTIEQRVSILNIHMRHMYSSGRLLVQDAPVGSSAAAIAASSSNTNNNEHIPSYDELLNNLASMCEGFSGASLAAVSRAAASHALERSVEDFATQHIPSTSTTSATTTQYRSLLSSCIVTNNDLQLAIQDVRTGQGDDDWTGDDDSVKVEGEESNNFDSSKYENNNIESPGNEKVELQ